MHAEVGKQWVIIPVHIANTVRAAPVFSCSLAAAHLLSTGLPITLQRMSTCSPGVSPLVARTAKSPQARMPTRRRTNLAYLTVGQGWKCSGKKWAVAGLAGNCIGVFCFD